MEAPDQRIRGGPVRGRATEAPPRPDATRQGPEDPPAQRPPWRVEGAPKPAGDGPARPDWRRVAGRTWWLILLLLIVNWIVASALMAPSRTTVSYTFFREQVHGRQRRRDHLDRRHHRGRASARRRSTRRTTGDAKDVTEFTTQRPAFADDGLTELLLREGRRR